MTEAATYAIPVLDRAALGDRIIRAGRARGLEHALDRCIGAQQALADFGFVAFCGFDIRRPEEFRTLLSAVTGSGPMENHEARTGRERVGEGVFTATDHPASDSILLHAEKAHTSTIPRHLALFAVQPARTGGGTLVAEADAIVDLLPPALRARLETRGLIFERTYFRAGAIDYDWRRAFSCTSRPEAEGYLARHGVEYRWLTDDALYTRWPTTAFVEVEGRGTLSWCNAILHYDPRSYFSETPDPSRRERAARMFAPERRLPFDSSWDDGTRLSDGDMAALLAAHKSASRAWRWEAGDVLIIDNTRMMHGREPYSGERRILVAMASPLVRSGGHRLPGASFLDPVGEADA